MEGMRGCHLVCGLVVLAACVETGGLSGDNPDATPLPPRGGQEAGASCSPDLQTDSANCGACGKACGQDEYCEVGACAPGCPGRVVYVSNDGNDTESGCFREKPKRTIGSAVGYVTTKAAKG